MTENKKILIGKIVAPQGIRGEVRVQSFAENPTDFKKIKVYGRGFCDDDFKFVRALPNSNVVIAKINGIDDRNAAESLRGMDLFIERDALPVLADGEYYQTDLIGFDVIRDGKKIGVVDCFQNFGAGDIIELDNGEMVSFAGVSVDLKNKTIYLK